MATAVKTKQSSATTINFETKLYKINDWVILRLPESVSKKLPSRGQVMVEGTLNGYPIQTPLEPDGKFSHWFRVDDKLLNTTKTSVGDKVKLNLSIVKDWPEPDIPADWKKALLAAPKQYELYKSVTPMARWEWLRWIRATNNQETRNRRIEVGISKLKNGERRPCCWNRNACTEPYVSKTGVLLKTE
jgi:hypothetical protein